MTITIDNIEGIRQAAADFAAAAKSRHFAFHAPMGAGKTTFISALCRALGSEDEASSPTFSIVNEYTVNPDGASAALPGGAYDKIYHFDFYRVDSPAELMDLGLDDYWDSDAPCFIEWPENAEGFLPDDVVDVEIEVDDDGRRIIKF